MSVATTIGALNLTSGSQVTFGVYTLCVSSFCNYQTRTPSQALSPAGRGPNLEGVYPHPFPLMTYSPEGE